MVVDPSQNCLDSKVKPSGAQGGPAAPLGSCGNRVDQGEVTESLGKVAQLAFAPRLDLFGVKTKWASVLYRK
jgi:hypothetical protein